MAEELVFEKCVKTTHKFELKKVSRSTCKSDICNLFRTTQTLITILSYSLHRISLISKCWEGLNSNNYFFIIAHFINHK